MMLRRYKHSSRHEVKLPYFVLTMKAMHHQSLQVFASQSTQRPVAHLGLSYLLAVLPIFIYVSLLANYSG